MAAWEDVRRIALAPPESSEELKRETRRWLVKDKLFVWERPLRPKEIEALESDIHAGPILGARVEHLGAKQAVLADDPFVFFTTPTSSALQRSCCASTGYRWRISTR